MDFQPLNFQQRSQMTFEWNMQYDIGSDFSMATTFG